MKILNKQSRLRETFTGIGLVVTSLWLACFMGEVLARLHFTLRYNEPFFRWKAYSRGAGELDPVLGWRATENYTASYEVVEPGGARSQVQFTQNSRGFRRFGDLDSPRRKVFVVGDSYTQAQEVSDHETYYAVLGHKLDAEIFGYGVGGYGTLQESMIVDRYVDLIRPDLIILQQCVNDFFNNSLTLESLTIGNNNFLVRPYWENGKVVYALPLSPRWGRYVPFTLQHSRLFRMLASRVRILHATRFGNDRDIHAQIKSGHHEPLFRQAVNTTSEILRSLKQRAGRIPLVGFDCETEEPFNAAWRRLAFEHGIHFVDAAAEAIKRHEEAGIPVRADEAGHWNRAGHQIIAEVMAGYIRSQFHWP